MEEMYIKSLLLDFYGPLLTERQRYSVEEHYEHDRSLSEIAEDLGVSRQAVHDNLQRAMHLLEEYETKLGLVKQYRERQAVVKELQETLQDTLDAEKMQAISPLLDLLAE